ncbi:MAG: AAA family ATPase, partial [candidate division KSB1 bacterium]|nr:AAA family ATPase [candidate division KSB1 bacterium]
MSDDKRIPNPAEIQREVAEFLKSKYGDRIFIPPQPDLASDEEAPRTEKRGVGRIRFDMKPEELEAYLKEYVIGQDEALEILATKICTHFNRMRLEMENQLEDLVGNIKPNILMIGPTGVGKTYMIRLIAKKIGVPFVKADAT